MSDIPLAINIGGIANETIMTTDPLVKAMATRLSAQVANVHALFHTAVQEAANVPNYVGMHMWRKCVDHSPKHFRRQRGWLQRSSRSSRSSRTLTLTLDQRLVFCRRATLALLDAGKCIGRRPSVS
jgi:hypothetical protein